MWGISFYFASPLQLLLLFFGRIETERPSDWMQHYISLLAGEPQTATQGGAQAAVISMCAALGLAISYALNMTLGDATWSLSTGIGACVAAGMYEIGRPTRLTVAEAEELESIWHDFSMFAEIYLQPQGRCHESESEYVRAQFETYKPWNIETPFLSSSTLL